MVQIDGATGSRRLARRREILRAASEIFRQKGFHGAGMRDIAAQLGIAVGKLYYWFESKQDLLAFCQRDTLERLLGMVAQVRALELSADTALFLVIRGHIRCLNRGTVGSLAHLEAESLEDPWRAPILSLRGRYERAVQEIVVEGLEAGIFVEVDAVLATLGILGAVNWTVKWYRPRGRNRLEAIERTFARTQVRGLLEQGLTLVEPNEDLVPTYEDLET